MIEIKNLTKSFANHLAVDNLSFTVNKGEVLGLLGPNGAGKTTTIRMLCGFLEPSSGDVTVKGRSVHSDTLAVKEMIGYLPESAPPYPEMLVYDYLQFVARVRGLAEDRIDARIHELSDMCGLAKMMHKNIGELSKGYKQRVGLAHAMMGDPEILVLDEPTSGLDPNQIIEIRELIKRIGREKTVILSSHILPEIEATCGRVVIINQGKLVANDRTDTLRQNASSGRRISVELAGVNEGEVKSILTSLAGIDSVESRIGKGDSHIFILHSRSTDDLRSLVSHKALEKGWTLLSLNQEERSLEDIFRQLTKD